jgi:hypothetical protein
MVEEASLVDTRGGSSLTRVGLVHRQRARCGMASNDAFGARCTFEANGRVLHCAPGTSHSFVGAGDGPCVMLMVGARRADGTIFYSRNEAAFHHGAGVTEETPSAREAYALFEHWHLGRPDRWDELPWNAGLG